MSNIPRGDSAAIIICAGTLLVALALGLWSLTQASVYNGATLLAMILVLAVIVYALNRRKS